MPRVVLALVLAALQMAGSFAPAVQCEKCGAVESAAAPATSSCKNCCGCGTRKTAARTVNASLQARAPHKTPAAESPFGSHRIVFFGQVVAASSGQTSTPITDNDLAVEVIWPVDLFVSDVPLAPYATAVIRPGACPAAGVAALRC